MIPRVNKRLKGSDQTVFRGNATHDRGVRVRSVALLTVLAACLGLVLLPLRVQAGQEVRVFVEADAEGHITTRTTALEQALQRGVVQEAEAVLRQRLEEPRLGVLRRILEAKASEYVLGYSEVAYEPTEWGAVLHVDVRVNRSALREFLQSIGVYYTLDHGAVTYVLQREALDAGAMALISDMETLSGLHRGDANDGRTPSLRITRASEGAWQGLLEYEGMSWSAQSAELPRLWADLWGNYFALDHVKQGYVNQLLLITRGWGGAVDVYGFDQVLRSWDLETGMVAMESVSLEPGRVQARWKITTMDRVGLEQRLQRVLRDRGVEYTIASP